MEILINTESYRLANEKIQAIIKDSKNVVTYDYNICLLDDILLEAGYYSMFQEEKYIIIKNATFFGSGKINDNDTEKLINYINNPSPLSTLIFVCNEKLDARKKLTKLLKEKGNTFIIPELKFYEIENKVKEYFNKLNYKIDQDSIKYIVSNSLNNYDLAMNEAEKIVLYYSEPSFIKYQEVTNLTAKSINTNNFLFVDALIDQDIKKSLELLEDIKIIKTEPTIILSLLARDYRIMLNIKYLLNQNKREFEIMKELELKDWQLEKYLKKAFPYKILELENILVKLSNIDLDIKSGKKDRYMALELLIIDLCE